MIDIGIASLMIISIISFSSCVTFVLLIVNLSKIKIKITELDNRFKSDRIKLYIYNICQTIPQKYSLVCIIIPIFFLFPIILLSIFVTMLSYDALYVISFSMIFLGWTLIILTFLNFLSFALIKYVKTV